MENSVTIRDNRNGKEYVLPIEEGSRERLQSQVQPLPGSGWNTRGEGCASTIRDSEIRLRAIARSRLSTVRAAFCATAGTRSLNSRNLDLPGSCLSHS